MQDVVQVPVNCAHIYWIKNNYEKHGATWLESCPIAAALIFNVNGTQTHTERASVYLFYFYLRHRPELLLEISIVVSSYRCTMGIHCSVLRVTSNVSDRESAEHTHALSCVSQKCHFDGVIIVTSALQFTARALYSPRIKNPFFAPCCDQQATQLLFYFSLACAYKWPALVPAFICLNCKLLPFQRSWPHVPGYQQGKWLSVQIA